MKVQPIYAPRVLVALCGDMRKDPESIVKYGEFLAALHRKIPVIDVYNAKPHSWQRLINAVPVWHPNLKKWSERANKNPRAFILRSRKMEHWIGDFRNRWDLVLQLGVLFDSGWNYSSLPCVIYTDYTAQMSARQPLAGRSPFRGSKLDRWIELERHALQQAAHVCVRSEMVRKSLLEDYGLPAEHVTVIGGGVNLDTLPELTKRPLNRPPTALFIGLEFYRKGGDLVLKAFAQARAVVPDAQLLFVTNDAIPSDLPREGVKVISSIWDRKEFLELYSMADVLVSPSRLETWGDVILEAMAFGLPCIGVTGQAMEEIIRNGETGLLIPPEDVTALADAFTWIIQQPLLCRQMGQEGRHIIAEEFTWNDVVNRLMPILELSTQSSISESS